MNWLRSETELFYVRWVQYSRQLPRGSGYCEDQGMRLEQRKRWLLFGLCVWTAVLAREELPAFAWIHRDIFGDFGGYTPELMRGATP